MPAPFLAPSLVRFRAAVNAAWPHRDHSSDGWIGDAAHKLVVSDHNPDVHGQVHAVDIDRDGIHEPTVLAALLASPAVHYAIHRRRIWQASDDYRPRVYTGSNPHTGHIHGSVYHNLTAETWKGLWIPLQGDYIHGRTSLLGSKGYLIRNDQAYLNGFWYAVAVDGSFGPETDAAVRKFQKRYGLKVDGQVGPKTREAFMTRRP